MDVWRYVFIMKKIKSGDIFSTPDVGKVNAKDKGDKRTFRCIDKDHVELIEPSKYQVCMDPAFRDGSWKKSAINHIEHEWYKQRGFEVIK